MNLKVALFASALLLGPVAPASADISAVIVSKYVGYQQTGPATISPSGGGNDAGLAVLVGESGFDGGYVTYPGAGSPVDLTDLGGTLWYLSPSMTPAALDAEFPSGTYAATATNSVTSASQTVDITYDNSLIPSVIPYMSATSYDALQDLNPSLGITLSYPEYSGGTLLSFIDVTTGQMLNFCTLFLCPYSNGIIAPNTFKRGDTYQYTLNNIDYMNYDPLITPELVDEGDVYTQGYFSVPVPEPATWGSLVLGIFGIGSIFRIRRKLIGEAVF